MKTIETNACVDRTIIKGRIEIPALTKSFERNTFL